MTHEVSCGIIPIKKERGEYSVLLVRLYAGHWGFPKGRQNPHENPLQTATRELLEETGLEVKHILLPQVFEENYMKGVSPKTVLYFIAEVEGSVIPQSEEIADWGWFKMKQVADRITFEDLKSLWLNVKELIEKKYSDNSDIYKQSKENQGK